MPTRLSALAREVKVAFAQQVQAHLHTCFKVYVALVASDQYGCNVLHRADFEQQHRRWVLWGQSRKKI